MSTFERDGSSTLSNWQRHTVMGTRQAKGNRSRYLQKPKPVITVLRSPLTIVILRFPAKNCNALQRLAKTAGLV
jgi:hypothetical protein